MAEELAAEADPLAALWDLLAVVEGSGAPAASYKGASRQTSARFKENDGTIMGTVYEAADFRITAPASWAGKWRLKKKTNTSSWGSPGSTWTFEMTGSLKTRVQRRYGNHEQFYTTNVSVSDTVSSYVRQYFIDHPSGYVWNDVGHAGRSSRGKYIMYESYNGFFDSHNGLGGVAKIVAK